MDMNRRFVAQVRVNEDGEILYVLALDNESLAVRPIEPSKAPEFLVERVALLRLCEISPEEGEAIGRKFSMERFNVYLSFDEYKQIIDLIGVQK